MFAGKVFLQFSGLKLRRATITIKSRVLMRVYNSEINVLPKGHSTEASKILMIDNLKRPACASKQDGLLLVTIQ